MAKYIKIALYILTGLFLVFIIYNIFFKTKVFKPAGDIYSNSIDRATAKQVANIIWTAMFDMGTDDEIIKTLLINKDGKSLDLIYEEFGFRSYGWYGKLPFNIGSWKDLFYWMKADKVNDLDEIIEHFKSTSFSKIIPY